MVGRYTGSLVIQTAGRAVANLAEICQGSLVARIPEGEVMLCGATIASEGELDNASIDIRVRPRNRRSCSSIGS
jgi:hypothetical protein